MKIGYTLSGGLSEGQMRQIHETALRIIDEIGMRVHTEEVPEAELFDVISSYQGVRIAGDRVYFAPALVEQCLADYRTQLRTRPPATQENVTILSPCHTSCFLDPESGKHKSWTIPDLIEAAKFVDTLYDEGVRGACPGSPGEIHPELRPLMLYKIGCEYCRSEPAVGIPSVGSADYIYEMAQVMGYGAPETFVFGVHPISPLKMEGTEFDIALHFWKKFGQSVKIATGPMPIMGVSSPIFFPASLAQAVAEGLAGFVFFKLLTGSPNVDFWFDFYAFDMKYGNFVFGGPEDALIALVRNQMSAWYGLPNSSGHGCLLTMAHGPDAQAAAEKTAKTLVALLAGANCMVGAGYLSLDEVFSAEQLLLDVEIVHWARRVIKGFEFSPDALGFDILRQVIDQGGDFLTHDSTLDHHRNTYWSPTLFEHLMKSQWENKGGPTLRETLRRRVREKTAAWQFELDEHKRRQVNAIYERAREKLT